MIRWKHANKKTIFLDTGAFCAKFNPHDSHRDDGEFCFRLISELGLSLVTTNAVVYESYKRILFDTRGNVDLCLEFLDYIFSGNIEIVRITNEDEREAKEKIIVYRDQKRFTLVDVLTFVVMEKNALIKAFTFDVGHFASMNFLTIPPITNITQFL